MAYDKKKVKNLFESELEEVPKDEYMKRNSIINVFISEHGKSMNEHSREYTKLLEEYIKNSKKTSKQKKLFKNVFFWVAIGTLFFSFFLFAGMCIYFSLQDFLKIQIEDLSGLISSLVGLLSLYIIIPKIIAEYLFNVKEDKHMAKIVKSVQKYDSKVFANMNTIESSENLEEEYNKKEMLYEMKRVTKDGIEEKEKTDKHAK